MGPHDDTEFEDSDDAVMVQAEEAVHRVMAGALAKKEQLSRIIKRELTDPWAIDYPRLLTALGCLARIVHEHSAPEHRKGKVPRLELVDAAHTANVLMLEGPLGETAVAGVLRAQAMLNYFSGRPSDPEHIAVEQWLENASPTDLVCTFTELVHAAVVLIEDAPVPCTCARSGRVEEHLTRLGLTQAAREQRKRTGNFTRELGPSALRDRRNALIAYLSTSPHAQSFSAESLGYIVDQLLPLALEKAERPEGKGISVEEALLIASVNMYDDAGMGNPGARAFVVDSHRHVRGMIKSARSRGEDPAAALAAGLDLSRTRAEELVAANDEEARKFSEGWWFGN